MQAININGKLLQIDVDPDTPLLWVIREQIGLTGTKFSCGEGLCGACTVLLDGKAVRSCVYPVSKVMGQLVTTIEGVDSNHPVMQAWQQVDVPQCGYCQCGQILSTVALLQQTATPNAEQIDAAMQNLCRCGTYPEIKQAVNLSIELNAKEI